jgi:hypothetical protein
MHLSETKCMVIIRDVINKFTGANGVKLPEF